MTPDQRIAALEARVEELEWQMAELLGTALSRPEGVTPHQFRAINLMAKNAPRVTSHEAMLFAVCPKPLDADDNIVKVQVCTMRKILKPHGISIETAWGDGYGMTSESAQKWKALVAACNNPANLDNLEDAA